jgi:hypothetical protein
MLSHSIYSDVGCHWIANTTCAGLGEHELQIFTIWAGSREHETLQHSYQRVNVHSFSSQPPVELGTEFSAEIITQVREVS